MAKRTMMMAAMYAPNTMPDEVWAKVEQALAQAGIDWDGEWETVECEECGSGNDCECEEEGNDNETAR